MTGGKVSIVDERERERENPKASGRVQNYKMRNRLGPGLEKRE